MPSSPRTLRLSVTDRCNLRCRYCMPAEGVPKIAHANLLTLERLAEVAEWLSTRVGIERIKLTGGEPLVRSGIESLITELRAIPGVREISLTTNGTMLAKRAETLKAAGLARATVSLDSPDPERYRELTRGGHVEAVFAGINAALAAGLTPLKLNAVLQRSTWEFDVPLLLDFAAARGVELRFIELMHTGTDDCWYHTEFVPLPVVRHWLADNAKVIPVATRACAPAVLTRVQWHGVEVAVGWITPRSQPFCERCDRLRLDARGRLHRCLMDHCFLELAQLLAEDGPQAAGAALESYLDGKTAPHAMDRPDAMIVIGG